MASSSSSTTNPQEKYDVFLSFRGEDTRVSFTSHLYAALKRKQILTFIDYELNRGEEISPSLLKAIEESKLSVVVFSENYASSKWCLEELAKILECKKTKGQMVIPVFYRVDPSHVRNQVGSFADVFARHEQLLKEKMDKVQNWRAAMKEAANLSGWDSENIKSESEFVEDIGTEAIEGICLEMSESREMHLKSDAFSSMDRLRLLKFYDNFSWDDIFLMDDKDKVHLPHSGLDYLSDELRYLHWDGFPLKTLPQNFCAENIVELIFPDSKIERLWTGVQNLVHLRCIDLSGSPYLLEIPDLSKAKNIESINLKFCKSLIEVHSSIQFLNKLEVLQLSYCDNLTRLPSSIGSKVLRILDLSYCNNVRLCPAISGNSAVLRKVDLQYCSNITKFPEISGKIKYLYLQGTAIEEVPSSIEFLTALVRLYMTNCKQLSSLPTSICKLKSLEILGLSSCSKLERFPEIMEPMESLRRLELDATAIQELPSSIKHLKFLTQLKLGVTAIKELSSSIVQLKSLTHLDLGGTAIQELPSSIIYLKCLKHLDLSGTVIKKLPELPLSLAALDVNDCESLETLSRFNLSNFQELNFAKCFKLDHKELLADIQLKIQSGQIKDENFQIVLPESEIPLWFCDQTMGSSVTKQFPSNCQQLKGIAFYIVFASPTPLLFDCVNFGCKCHAKSNNGEHDYVIFMDAQPKAAVFKFHDSDHMLLWYESTRKGLFSEYSGNEVTFEFYNKIELSKMKSSDEDSSDQDDY
ncbi:unnamed protein product [Dovyalis caffra]|uniref:TIR domain-containing protein n=1 Tax=Dovyalis caffra TaxID=77055 RepID=A0AAV1SHS4_9ROSI|nr:unnamed protein product [Dovyalis caffra]